MKRFDLYGAVAESIEALGAELEGRLGRQFIEHESAYRGGVYFRAPAPPEEIVIQPHEPDEEGYFAEPDFERWPLLVYVNDSARWPEIEPVLQGMEALTLLRSEEI
jgi:hypothetical protein